MVKLLFAIITTNFDAVFLDQQRNKVAAIPLAIALDTANFVKEGGQDTCVWVANTGEGISQSSSIEANAEELAKLLTISIDDARKLSKQITPSPTNLCLLSAP